MGFSHGQSPKQIKKVNKTKIFKKTQQIMTYSTKHISKESNIVEYQ